MQAIQYNCSDAYGAMIWDISADYTESFFKAWNVQTRMAFDVPRETHKYVVEDILCENLPSLKCQVLSRYPNFVKNLKNSPSKEVRILVGILHDDPNSPTFKNIQYIKEICKNEDVLHFQSWEMFDLIPRNVLPDGEMWRKRLLLSLLDIRSNRSFGNFNLSCEDLSAMIDSLCIS